MTNTDSFHLALLLAGAGASSFEGVGEYPTYDELFHPNRKGKGMIFAEMNGNKLEARENKERLRDEAELLRRRKYNIVRVPYLKAKDAHLRRTPRCYSLAATEQSAPSLDSFTKADLVSLAREAGVPGRSKMNKGELYQALYG